MNLEVWNIAIASVLLMLVYASVTSAFDMLNASLDDSNTNLTSKLGYECSSINSFISIGGSFIVPFLQCLGYRILIAGSALFHVPLFLAMIFLNEYAIIAGAAIHGIADGVVWVVVFDYVVSVSQKKNIERNMSYFIFTYSFAALLGNLINYFNLDSPKKITDSSRIHIYSFCTVVTVIAALLGAFGLRKMPNTSSLQNSIQDSVDRLAVDSDAEDYRDHDQLLSSNTSSMDRVNASVMKRLFNFIVKPATLAQGVTSVVSGMYDAWVVIIFTCIRNTYSDRHLLPICGLIFGCCKIIFSGVWNKLTVHFGYKVMVNLITIITLFWLLIIMAIFPPISLHDKGDSSDALLPQGAWAVYLLGLVTGISRTWMDVLKQISCGTCSRADDVMEGFKPSVMFTVKTIIWSSASAITYAVVPFVNFYALIATSLFGLIVNHIMFLQILLGYFGASERRARLD